MSVAQAVKINSEKLKKNKKLLSVIKKQVSAFVLSFLFGYSELASGFAPLGAAFAASTRGAEMPAAFFGAVTGYVLKNDSLISLRYFASLMALGVIFFAIKPFKALSQSSVMPVITSFLCLLVTGLAIAFSKEITIISILAVFCEALLGGAAAYLFLKVRTVLSLKGGLFSLSSKEAVAVAAAGALLLSAVKDIELFGIHPAHICAVFAVLLCAFYSREAGGATVGVATGAVLSLGGGELLYLSAFSFGGLMSGVASTYGKIPSFLAFALSTASIAVFTRGEVPSVALIAEIAVAGALFLIMPKKAARKAEELLMPAVASPVVDSVKTGIIRRLKTASLMSEEICDSLTTVSTALIKNERAELSGICKKTRESICGSCGLYDACWNEAFADTQDSFNTLIAMKKEGVYLEYKTVPSEFSAKCIRTEMVASSFNRLYSEYKVKERFDARVNEIYTLASEQFINVSALLESLSESVSREVRFDGELAARIVNTVGACGYEPLKCCCVFDDFEKLSVELTIKMPSGSLNFSSLIKQMEIVTSTHLSSPEKYIDGVYLTLVFKETPELRAVYAGRGICCNSEKYSGDTYSVFFDGDGFLYAVICDGMGTGMRAAVNSNLAVSLFEKLIKAGFGVEASLATLNTSLISKSGDECSVTLDLAKIDLYTGHIDFYKCGASPTYVKKQGRLLEVDCPSLPLGIIKNTDSGKGTGTLFAGDVIVMVSDGVRDEDIPFLRSELKGFCSGNVNEFCDSLARSIKEAQPEKNDDITVLTVALSEY